MISGSEICGYTYVVEYHLANQYFARAYNSGAN